MRFRISILTILLALSMVQGSESATDTTQEQRVAYERELNRLKQDNPKQYENSKRTATLIAQLLLGQLGYGVGPYSAVLDNKTEQALRDYQKNRNLTPTGDPLTFETFNQMGKDMELINYNPVSLPTLHVYTEFWESGNVWARGTWVLGGEKMSLPEQTTLLECYRDRGVCTEATAIVSKRRSLTVDIDEYKIERWDDYEIVTQPKQFECVRYVRRFNRAQKTVTGLRSTTSTEGFCKGVEGKEMHMTLSDGYKVNWDLQQDVNKMREGLMRLQSRGDEIVRAEYRAI